MKQVIGLIAAIIVVLGVVWGLTVVSNNKNDSAENDAMTNVDKSTNSMNDSNDKAMNDNIGDEAMDDNINDSDDSMDDSNTNSVSNAQYIDYSESNLESTKYKTQVLFFHAKWCPTCKAADQEFTANLDQLPDNVVLIKTDYDTQTALKQKHGITYQHTFVQIDENGNQITKWNGGDVEELISNIQ